MDKVKNSKSVISPADGFGSFLKVAEKNIKEWIEAHKLKKFSVGMLQIENLAAILSVNKGQEIVDLLISVVQEIFSEFKTLTRVERVSIDSFIFVIAATDTALLTEKIELLIDKLRKCSSKMNNFAVYISPKVGLAFYENSIVQSIDSAYIALYECKLRDSMHYCFYENIKESVQDLQKEIKVAGYFQKMMHENRLLLAYQPLIISKSGKVKSYETLLRILTEDNEVITAGPLIPVAERYGFIDQIDCFVLEAVVNELKQAPDLSLAVNVSNLSVDSTRWVTLAKQLLSDVDIASRLTVEITETGMQRNLAKIEHFVEMVQSWGCLVAIDDFGAGYTSFTQLKTLNVDYIKIDGAFIRDIIDNPGSKLFVKTLMGFAKAYGLKTVAEFVENGEIAKVLIEMDIDYLQGYYFSKPVTHRPWIKTDKVN